MLLTHDRLVRLIADGVVINTRPSCINAASMDVHLSGKFLRESPAGLSDNVVDIAAGDKLHFAEISKGPGEPLVLMPGQFVLAATEEVFALPADISALFVMKSSVARCGLDQMNAAWCSPGWIGSSLTLELVNVTNYHHLLLQPGMAIGQMVFFQGDAAPIEKLYSARGKFNNQTGPSGNF